MVDIRNFIALNFTILRTPNRLKLVPPLSSPFNHHLSPAASVLNHTPIPLVQLLVGMCSATAAGYDALGQQSFALSANTYLWLQTYDECTYRNSGLLRLSCSTM